MGLAWSLPTGFDTPITYFYVMYFAVLLIHRQMRDDENCEKKHAVSPPFSFSVLTLPAGMERIGTSIANSCRTVSFLTFTDML